MRDNAAIEGLGDPRSMLVLRDVIFDNPALLPELLHGSEEGDRVQHPQQLAQAARRRGPAHPGGRPGPSLATTGEVGRSVGGGTGALRRRQVDGASHD